MREIVRDVKFMQELLSGIETHNKTPVAIRKGTWQCPYCGEFGTHNKEECKLDQCLLAILEGQCDEEIIDKCIVVLQELGYANHLGTHLFF